MVRPVTTRRARAGRPERVDDGPPHATGKDTTHRDHQPGTNHRSLRRQHRPHPAEREPDPRPAERTTTMMPTTDNSFGSLLAGVLGTTPPARPSAVGPLTIGMDSNSLTDVWIAIRWGVAPAVTRTSEVRCWFGKHGGAPRWTTDAKAAARTPAADPKAPVPDGKASRALNGGRPDRCRCAVDERANAAWEPFPPTAVDRARWVSPVTV